jgi:two-component system phosphate regulon sensor histidine kinase PhoR
MKLWEDDPGLTQSLLLNELRNRREYLSQLAHRKRVGYSKIESFTIPGDAATDPLLVLLYMAELPDRSYFVLAMLINSQSFITDILAPKLQEVARTEFDLGVFRTGEFLPVYAVNTVEDTTGFMKRRIWLFPDHYLGVRMSGTSIQDIVRNRFKRNLQLIALLDVLLLIGAWVVIRNIRKEVQLSRMKSDFVSNVSHELRTPLALIRMFIETLEMGRVKTEEKKKEYYTIIGQETERLTHLINNILDFSRMEAGRKQYHREPVHINEVVAKTLSMYEYHLKNNRFEFETELSDEDPEINADPHAVTEALINLLENAIKYSEERKYVAIRTSRDNREIVIEVEDHGLGISADQQKKIFDKFYRISSGLTHNTKGSGLGLSIVKHIMNAHNGSVTVSSQPGRGSRFQLRFPQLSSRT